MVSGIWPGKEQGKKGSGNRAQYGQRPGHESGNTEDVSETEGRSIISVSEWGQIFPSGGSLVLDRVRVKLPTASESHGSSVRRVPY